MRDHGRRRPHRRRARPPRRRRDLLRLSAGLFAGYATEAVLGGLTVLAKLAPALVAVHLVVAMLVLAGAVTLHWLAGHGTGPHLPASEGEVCQPFAGGRPGRTADGQKHDEEDAISCHFSRLVYHPAICTTPLGRVCSRGGDGDLSGGIPGQA